MNIDTDMQWAFLSGVRDRDGQRGHLQSQTAIRRADQPNRKSTTRASGLPR